MKTNSIKHRFILPAVLVASSLMIGCAEENAEESYLSPDIRLQLPDSLTGGTLATAPRSAGAQLTRSDDGLPCFYQGVGDDDPFQNGYHMTKFMVSAIAVWTCVADAVIDLAEIIPHDGEIHQSDDNTYGAVDYDPEEPTHYSITDDSDTQVSVRLYYGYTPEIPPQVTENPGFFVSWNETSDGDISGRMIIDAQYKDDVDLATTEDPIAMRVDFDFTASQRVANMYLQFGDNNEFANGFHIEVTKDLTAAAVNQVYLARGIIDMKAQFHAGTTASALPVIKMYTVADGLGEGAAVSEFSDIAIAIELNAVTENHLGEYLFTNTDTYYFQADQDSDFINKQVTSSEYLGLRTTPATGGSWVPFDPSLELLVAPQALDLGATYFTMGQCENIGDSCNELINAIAYSDNGLLNAEQNLGTLPTDWRATAIASPVYLDSVYPVGYTGWAGVFDPVYMP